MLRVAIPLCRLIRPNISVMDFCLLPCSWWACAPPHSWTPTAECDGVRRPRRPLLAPAACWTCRAGCETSKRLLLRNFRGRYACALASSCGGEVNLLPGLPFVPPLVWWIYSLVHTGWFIHVVSLRLQRSVCPLWVLSNRSHLWVELRAHWPSLQPDCDHRSVASCYPVRHHMSVYASSARTSFCLTLSAEGSALESYGMIVTICGFSCCGMKSMLESTSTKPMERLYDFR